MNPAKRSVAPQADPSPHKKRSKRNQEEFIMPTQAARLRFMQSQLDEMRKPPKAPVPSPSAISSSSGDPLAPPAGNPCPPPEDSHMSGVDSQDAPPDSQCQQQAPEMLEDALPPPSAGSPAKKTRKDEQEDLTRRWKELLARLVDPLLMYWDRTVGVFPEGTFSDENPCTNGGCDVEKVNIHVIYFDHHRVKTFHHCQCRSLAETLVLHGLFPTSPSQPRMAISIVLLDFYQSLCQHSSDAVTALAGGLATVYRRLGFRLLGPTGEALQDPIRRALGRSMQWYDALVLQVDRYLLAKVDSVKDSLPPLSDTLHTLSSPLRFSTAISMVSPPSGASSPTESGHQTISRPITSHSETVPATEAPPDVSNGGPEAATQPRSGARLQNRNGTVHRYLQRICPPCFAAGRFGQSFQDGGDLHVAIDGNFHHRHLKSGGDGTRFCESVRVLSKETVDAVGQRIEAARAKPPKQRVGVVPDDVVDSDRDSYKAANGDKQGASGEAFDEKGVMALVCRHDIPLFIASIDTPGEQQKYAVALLEALFAMLPSNAIVAALYDVACVLDRSIHLYEILPDSILARLQLATAVMHAYGHQWVCQLYYNPRLRVGLGITDGEGVERLWSRLRKLIGIERRASRASRLWMLDRQCDAIARDLRQGLGKWIRRRLHKNIQKKEADAVRTIRRLGLEVSELRMEWHQQKQAQTSARSLAPARLKKELAKVLQLQDQIDTLEGEIAETKATIKRMPFPPADATFILPRLEKLHGKLKAETAQLYASLNLDDRFPELRDVPLDYLHTLILARDLKIAIRKKVIGSFFEWDRVDSAVGGTHEAIGTKVHQATRNAITKRAPAIENLIRKFNQYVTHLEKHHRAHYRVPIPERLPTQLASLRDMENSHLWEDVWISQTETPPRWLVDEGVRKGIQAVLNLDRCAEDRARLWHEAKNLCIWFRDELRALKLMVRNPQFAKYRTLLRLALEDHLLLAESWSNPFVPASVFHEQIALVDRWLQSTPVSWLPTAPSRSHPHSHPAPAHHPRSHLAASAPSASSSPASLVQEVAASSAIAGLRGPFASPALNSPFSQSPTSSSAPPVTSPTYSSFSPTPSTFSPASPTTSSTLFSPTSQTPSLSVPASPTPSLFLSASPTPTLRAGPSTSPLPPASATPATRTVLMDDEDTDDEVEITGESIALRDVIEDDYEDEEEDMDLSWEALVTLKVDSVLPTAVAKYAFPRQSGPSNSPRIFKPPSSQVEAVFSMDQYRRIDTSDERLDDECINGCAGLLHQVFGSKEVECAILSSFVVPQLLRPDSPTSTAWNISKRSEYWLKPIWIIPIHDKSLEHWALAVIRVDIEEILIFDSFANRSFISKWLPNIQRVIRRLVTIAKDQGHIPASSSLSNLPSWTCRPLLVNGVQSNGYDCGVWILWVIAAVVRGFDWAAKEERDIHKFRKFLAHLIRTIPS